MQFGPEGPEFGRLYGMTKLPLNASLLPMWAAGASDIATEMLKWERARNFSTVHNMVDMAYDGAFFRADVADFCSAVNSSRPEWIFTDDEGFPGTWGYSEHGALSENAKARRVHSPRKHAVSAQLNCRACRICTLDLSNGSPQRQCSWWALFGRHW